MIVAGTGHRLGKLGGYSTGVKAKLTRIAMRGIRRSYATEVITGMALGWDTALAVACWTLSIPFTAAVPFRGQESRWPKEGQELYHWLLDRAKEVVYVSDGGYAPWKMQARNEWMIDNCDGVLALWDGSNGGTGNCIAYADKVGRPVVNLYEEYKNEEVPPWIAEINGDLLIQHLKTGQKS